MARYSKPAYTEIAALLKASHSTIDIAMRLADLFECDNQQFDRQRFYRAAGMKAIPTEEERDEASKQPNT